MIAAIACTDNNWCIGKDNHLLFHIKDDLRFFNKMTVGNVVCMGKNTLLSLPGSKPLKDRTNIVLSSTSTFDDCICCKTLSELIACIKEAEKSTDVFIIGGGQLYKALLHLCDKVYITKVNAFLNGDVFFPNLDFRDDFELCEQSPIYEENGLQYKFCIYEPRQRQRELTMEM